MQLHNQNLRCNGFLLIQLSKANFNRKTQSQANPKIPVGYCFVYGKGVLLSPLGNSLSSIRELHCWWSVWCFSVFLFEVLSSIFTSLGFLGMDCSRLHFGLLLLVFTLLLLLIYHHNSLLGFGNWIYGFGLGFKGKGVCLLLLSMRKSGTVRLNGGRCKSEHGSPTNLLHYNPRRTEQGYVNWNYWTLKHRDVQLRFMGPKSRCRRMALNIVSKRKIEGSMNVSLLHAANEDVKVQQGIETMSLGNLGWVEYSLVVDIFKVKTPRELGAAGGGGAIRNIDYY